MKSSSRIEIPRENADLRRMILRRTVPSYIAGICSVAAFIALEANSILTHWDNPSHILNSTFLYLFLCMVPIGAFKVWDRIRDRSFEGQIVELTCTSRMQADNWFHVGGRHRINIANLVVRGDDGTLYKHEYEFKGRLPFATGSRIRHYIATDYMYLLDPDKPIVCINCGEHYTPRPAEDDEDSRYDWTGIRAEQSAPPPRCGYCKKTLIRRPSPQREDIW